MSQQLEQVVLEQEGIRKFQYGDLAIAANIQDELDFVVRNHAELYLSKLEQHHRARGAILSCIGEHGVITQFHTDGIDGFAEDGLAFSIREAIRAYNPDEECVVVHVGRDTQASVEKFPISRLYDLIRQRMDKFGVQDLSKITTTN